MSLNEKQIRNILQTFKKEYEDNAKSDTSGLPYSTIAEAFSAALRAIDELTSLKAQVTQQIAEAEEQGYDLGCQSVLHNFLNYPWADAKIACDLLKDSIKAKQEKRLLSLPCAPGSQVYIIDTDGFNCEVCKHGADAPPTKCERFERKHYRCGCGEYCPLFIRAVDVEGFVVSANKNGWLVAYPFRWSDSATPGEKISVRIQGITEDVFYQLESAQEFLEHFAQKHNADILPDVRHEN